MILITDRIKMHNSSLHPIPFLLCISWKATTACSSVRQTLKKAKKKTTLKFSTENMVFLAARTESVKFDRADAVAPIICSRVIMVGRGQGGGAKIIAKQTFSGK